MSWNNEACGCERPNSGSTPPAGYGSCPSGQYWNGSGCQQNNPPPTSSESPEEACRRGGGCAWTGSACNCPSSQPSQSSPPSEPAPTSVPTSNPQ